MEGAPSQPASRSSGSASEPRRQSDDRPHKRVKHLNCAECRRLKLKCDRQIPCQNCVKRGCGHLCPDGARFPSKSDNHELTGLRAKLRMLEGFLENRGFKVSECYDLSVETQEGGENRPMSESHELFSTNNNTVLPGDITLGTTSGVDIGNITLSPSAVSNRSHALPQTPSRAQLLPIAAETPLNLVTFPFSEAQSKPGSIPLLLSKVPSPEEAVQLIDSYSRYFAWRFDIVSRAKIHQTLDWALSSPDESTVSKVQLQELGLLFMVLAMGSLYSLELPPDDPIAEEYHWIAQQCLANGEFMTHNSITGIQALHVMAHFRVETEGPRDGNSAWPLWGLSMGISQAIGLHRDGQRMNLPPDVVEERRRVFWECRTAEVFQANCFSRPISMIPAYYDTLVPTSSGSQEGLDFFSLKFELCKIGELILDQALRVETPAYDVAEELYGRLCQLERSIPFHLRCRVAFLALPSVYPNQQDAIRNTPSVNKRDLRRTFEQHTFALAISENVIHIFRLYFMRAIGERPDDPSRSIFEKAFLAFVERCNSIIEVCKSLCQLHPAVAARHWFIWYHAFGSAACLGTLILMAPTSPLVPASLARVDDVISLYVTIVRTRSSNRLMGNLDTLKKIRQHASEKLKEVRPAEPLVNLAPLTAMTTETSIPPSLSHASTIFDTSATLTTPMNGQRFDDGVEHDPMFQRLFDFSESTESLVSPRQTRGGTS